MTVLVVDDEFEIRDVLAQVLEEEGYGVVEAANGQDAITYLQTQAQPPCLILLDLMMPVMSGWQFRSEQQRNPQFANIPVVIVSAVQNLSQEASSLGVAGHIPKPISFDKLLATVQRFCIP